MSQTRPSSHNNQAPSDPRRRRLAWAVSIVGLLLIFAAFLALRTRLPANGAPNAPMTPIAADAATPDATAQQAAESPLTQSVAVAVSPLRAPQAANAGAQAAAESPLAAPAQTDAGPTATPAQLPRYGYEIVNTFPHDPNAFTQGLVFDGDTLYEGTGLNGRSSLRQVDLASGEVLRQVDLPQQYFGEGITVWDDHIVQLTWQSHQGFVYDKGTFDQQGSFTYPTEGWGITQDGRRLIMSDGTATLYFWDAETYQPVDEVDVYDLDGPVYRLNELEYVKGEIFANVWQTDLIARIDPVSGQVLGWIDLTGLLAPEDRPGADVLNGIAYQPESDRLFVTGKLWPKLFEIRLTPLAQEH